MDNDYYDTDEGKRALAHYLSHLNGCGVNRPRNTVIRVLVIYAIVTAVLAYAYFVR